MKKTSKGSVVVFIGLSTVFLIIVFSIAFAIRGSNERKYTIAHTFFQSEDYSAAQRMYSELGNYKDSSKLEKESKKLNAILTAYKKAEKLFEGGKYEDAITNFEEVEDFKDSKEKIKEAKYRLAVQYFENKNYGKSKQLFEELKDFKDSKEKVKEAKYGLAVQYFKNKDYGKSKQLFKELKDYSESNSYLDEIDRIDVVQLTESIYEKACKSFDSGEYEEALKDFNSILQYNDSEDKAKDCKIYLKRQSLNNSLAAGIRNSLAITSDYKVKVVVDNDSVRHNIESWKDIISIDAYGCLSIGLKKDGNVTVAGRYDGEKRVDVRDWNHIIDVAAGERFVLGLRDNGTVKANGHGDDGQTAAVEWKNIIAIDAGWRFAVGLTKKHGLKFAGVCNNLRKQFTADKKQWKDVINIAASGGDTEKSRGRGHVVGLRLDGTVIAIGDNDWGQCNVKKWQNVVKVVAGDWYTVGLTEEGKVLITGKNQSKTKYIEEDILEEINRRKDVVDIAAGYGQTLCLHRDGTISAFGFDDDEKSSEASKWSDLLVR